jgi:pyruvate-formate lyase-activating enzyme
MVLDKYGISTCCASQMMKWPSTGNFKGDIERYYAFCKELSDNLNNGVPTSCDGCYELRDGRSDDDFKIVEIGLTTGLPGGDTCNFKCSYCAYEENLGGCDRNDNVYEIIQQIDKLLDIKILSYSCGEITVSPYRHEILRYWISKKWKGSISTNGAICMQEICDLLRNRLIMVSISLDGGTANTFAKIKGVDCFEKVKKNVEKYAATGGDISLKYLLIEGVNDNKADIDGFMAIAARINAHVVISRNSKMAFTKMSEKEYSMVLQLVQQCKDKNLKYAIFANFFAAVDIDRLKKDGV